MKIHFVDGPLDGTSMHIEGKLNDEYFTPSMPLSPKRIDYECDAYMKNMFYIHCYRKCMTNPRTKTVIYIYDGSDEVSGEIKEQYDISRH